MPQGTPPGPHSYPSFQNTQLACEDLGATSYDRTLLATFFSLLRLLSVAPRVGRDLVVTGLGRSEHHIGDMRQAGPFKT